MKGFAFNVVIAILIAIVGVSIFIMLISGSLQNASTTIYCNTYVKLINLIPSSEGPIIPEICRFNAAIKTKEFDYTDNKIVSRILLAYIIQCWNDVENLRIDDDYSCYELRVSGMIDNVTEENVSSILIKEDHCSSIENSDYNCGAKNQIMWDVDGNISSSLNKSIMVNIINNNTLPNPIPVNESMIPDLSDLIKKSELSNYLREEIPESICGNVSINPNTTCEYNINISLVNFNITDLTTNNSQYYLYNIDNILAYLEKIHLIYSPINTQKVLLIRYDSQRECIVVKG
jgi:hypothetical protein